jgi:hypothetical protein
MSNVQYYTIIENRHQCNWGFGHESQHKEGEAFLSLMSLLVSHHLEVLHKDYPTQIIHHNSPAWALWTIL